MQIQNVKPQEIDAKYQSRITREGKIVKVDAEGLYYRELNAYYSNFRRRRHRTPGTP
jgi:hypothetical protein